MKVCPHCFAIEKDGVIEHADWCPENNTVDKLKDLFGMK
jgi:hypothetical protein